MPLTLAEAIAASVVTFLASAIISAYLAGWFGLTIAPLAILAVAIAVSAGAWGSLRRRASPDRGGLVSFVTVVAVVFGWLLWRARPELLPTGTGPDLVHHLALIGYIEQHWQLVHDVRLSEYLGEMVDYTPGVHLLVALAAAWLRIDGLHATYPVIAFTVAVKIGFVFLIARRFVPAQLPPDPFALVAVFAVLVPRVYSIGSFTEQSYLAQVASELFAIAAWWAIVVWDQQVKPAPMTLFAIFGVATFLVWPVWTGPLLIVLGILAAAHTDVPRRARARQIAPAVASIAVVAVMHAARHVGGLRMAGTGGFAIAPTVAVVGWPFFAVSGAGTIAAALWRPTRVVALLIAAIALQAATLLMAARASGAAAPYLSIKMFYFAIYPMAIASAIFLSALWLMIGARIALLKTPTAAWTVAAIVAVAAAKAVATAPRPKPVVSEAVLDAAAWARQHAPIDCIDYLTRDGYTAYWLHLAVFGQPRASGRAMNDETFEPKQALVRWILPAGLPYAITDDLSALPRDIRDNVDVLARFGPAAVVKRRGEARCP